jgi:hypothetical protein
MDKEIHDDVLGMLRHDSYIPGYRVDIDYSSFERVQLTIDMGDVEDEDIPRIVRIARETYSALQSRTNSFRQAIAEEFLTEYNQICRQDNPVDEQQFLRNIRLESIELWYAGSGAFCLSNLYYIPDGLEDFFGDHPIQITVNPELQIQTIE